MPRLKIYNFVINESQFKGTAQQIIPALEGAGYQAEREEQNPHYFWQYAEHLKRIR